MFDEMTKVKLCHILYINTKTQKTSEIKRGKNNFFCCRVFTVRRSKMKLRCFLKNAKDVCCLIDDMRAAIADLKFLP